MTVYHFRTWGGIGDCIYLRPAIRGLLELGEVWVETAMPELYEDLPVRFVRPESLASRKWPTLDLRHNRRNVDAQAADRWAGPPPDDSIPVRPYVLATAPNLVDGFLQDLRTPQGRISLEGPHVLDLPEFGPPPLPPPYIVVRPASIRAEWPCPSRNPDPGALHDAAYCAMVQHPGATVVSVADLEDGVEWALEPLPKADVVKHAGEYSLVELLALIQHAELVVGGVGWIVPAALAYGTPTLVVAGGRGRRDCPEWLAPPWADTSRMRWLVPDNFCRCDIVDHDCPKTISGVAHRTGDLVRELVGAR